MNQTKKRFPWQKYIGIAFMLLMGAICGFVMGMYLDKTDADASLYEELLSLAGLFLGMYAALVFHLLLHEAGHLVFGLLTGYQFSSFRIFSFVWLKEGGKFTVKRLSLAGTGGQCLMSPPDLKEGKFPFVLYNFGGSLANLIAGALFLTGYLLCPDMPFLSPVLLIFAVVGVMTAMMNGIPMRMGTVDNDGYNAFALSRNKEAAEAFWVQLKIAEQSAKGIRLKDMPPEWFAVPSETAMKNSMAATRGVFACNRLMDEEKFEEADALMAHLLEMDSGMVGLHRDLLICDRLYIELVGENRREAIETMLTRGQRKFMKAMRRYPSVLRTQYALALLFEKDRAKAEKVQNEFDRAAKTYPYPHEIDSERELMELAACRR